MATIKQKLISAAAIAAGTIVCGAAHGQVSAPAPATLDLMARARGAMFTGALTIQTVQPSIAADGDVSATVTLGTAAYTLELEPISLRSTAFQLFVQGEDGELRQVDAPTPATYRGHVAGQPLSKVTASVRDGQLYATVRLSPYNVWHVQPMTTVIAEAAVNQHAVYAGSDVQTPEYECGAAEEMTPAQHLEHSAAPTQSDSAAVSPATLADDESSGGGQTRGGLQATEIAYDADVEYFQLNGSSVTNCVNDIELILNEADELYQPLGIAYILRAIIVRTAEPDPYSPSGSLTSAQMRDEVITQWTANHAGIPRDIVHLMTNRNSSDGFIGWASGSVICSQSNGYAWTSGSWNAGNIPVRAALTAHELGHNWSACHCNQNGCTGGGVDPDCGIMCNNPAGCTAGPTVWGVRSTTAILNHLSTRTCLSSLLNTVYVDGGYAGVESGTLAQPFNTVREGSWAVSRGGGTLSIDTGNYNTRIILRRPMTLIAPNGIVNIGQ